MALFIIGILLPPGKSLYAWQTVLGFYHGYYAVCVAGIKL